MSGLFKTDRGLAFSEYHLTNSALIFPCQEFFWTTGRHVDLQHPDMIISPLIHTDDS